MKERIPRNDKDPRPSEIPVTKVEVSSQKAQQILEDLERDWERKHRIPLPEQAPKDWFNVAQFKSRKKNTVEKKATSLNLVDFKKTVSDSQKLDFLNRLEQIEGHWVWKGKGKYPRTSIEGKSIRVHRYAFEAFLETLPSEGEVVIRTCGHTKCCRPNHLKATKRNQRES